MGNEIYEGFDRVSSILDTYQDPGLIKWKVKVGAKEAKRISNLATGIGTNVDEYIKAQITNDKLPKLKTVEAENCIRAWNKFREDYCVITSCVEVGKRIFCEQTKITGEPDLILKGRELEVLDIKCSSEIRTNYWLQTNWYATKLSIPLRSVLRLDKNLGVYEYERREVSSEDQNVFDALTKVYRYFKPVKEVEE